MPGSGLRARVLHPAALSGRSARLGADAHDAPRRAAVRRPGRLPRSIRGRAAAVVRTVPAYFAARHATFPPDYVFAYSDQAVDLLGVVVERVSGAGFVEYVTRGILEPLGMGSSGLPATRATRPFLAKGYGRGRGACR